MSDGPSQFVNSVVIRGGQLIAGRDIVIDVGGSAAKVRIARYSACSRVVVVATLAYAVTLTLRSQADAGRTLVALIALALIGLWLCFPKLRLPLQER